MYISRIKVQNWKNFPAVDVHLTHRTFLIGPNASGKSNFLDVFKFLRDLCTSSGGLAQAVDANRGGVSAIRCLSARRYSDVSIEVDLTEEGPKGPVWNYQLVFNQDTKKTPVVRRESVIREGRTLLERPDEADRADCVRLTETALEQTLANQSFRDIATFFRKVSYSHLLPQLIRDPSSFSPAVVRDDPFGRDFLRRVANTPPRTKDSRLKKIVQALQAATPQLNALDVKVDEATGIPHLVGAFKHWRPHAAKQTEAQLSDGTLRLFGLLWSLFEGDGVLLMEEPELSLHSEIVRLLPQLIERVNRHRKVRRQIAISTHSKEMLADPGIGAEEVLRFQPGPEGTTIVPCSREEAVRLQHDSGLTVAEAVFPRSAPSNAQQMLFLFD